MALLSAYTQWEIKSGPCPQKTSHMVTDPLEGAAIQAALNSQELLAYAIERLVRSAKYTPARLSRGQEWFIEYYVEHPVTKARVRKREKVNRIRDRSERERFAFLRMRELNVALALGWTPFHHAGGAMKAPKLIECLEEFLKGKVRDQKATPF